jgi:hypothetical protein
VRELIEGGNTLGLPKKGAGFSILKEMKPCGERSQEV